MDLRQALPRLCGGRAPGIADPGECCLRSAAPWVSLEDSFMAVGSGQPTVEERIEEPVRLVLDGVQLADRFPANQCHVNFPFREAGNSVHSH